MRVFVTGATGFVGSAVVKGLLSAGHQVLGLSRSAAGVKQLQDEGAEAVSGTIEDLEVLRKAASESDAVTHLAFVHDFANFKDACATDRAAISALGDALVQAGGDRALVITSGTALLAGGKLGDEDDAPDSSNPISAARGASEALCLEYAKKGVRASVVRLPPTTHGPGTSGFTGVLIGIALQKGLSGYLGEGQNVWNAGHRDDAAKVYRLAVEKGKAASIYHAVNEESLTLKEIATEVGKHLDVPVVRVPLEKAEEHFGWFTFGLQIDRAASSFKTRERLGWKPTAPTLKEDIPIIIEYMKSQAKQ